MNKIEDKSLLHNGGLLIIDDEKVGESERMRRLRAQLPEPQRCTKCPNPLFDTMKSSDEEPYRIGGKPVCRECFFNELGEEIERHPIGFLPRMVK